jgi:O-antigen/teichoic acid export membrane protein
MVVKNTAAQIASRGIEGATNVVVAILLARVLGAASLGGFTYLSNYGSLFVFLGTLGLNLLMAREVARCRGEARRYLSNALGMGLVLAIITLAAQVGIIRLVSSDPLARKGVYLAAAFTIFHSGELLFVGVFYALERMELETLGIVIEKAALLAAVLALMRAGYGVLAVLAAFAGAKVLLCLVYLVVSRRLVGFPRPAFDLALWRRLAAEGWPFSLNLLLTAVYFQAYVVVLLAIMVSDESAGYFRAGSIVALGLPLVAAGLNNALLPLMARAHPDRREAFELGLERSFTALALLGLPSTAGLIALAPPLVRALFGPRFAPAVLCFQLVAVTVPLKFAASTIGTGLTAANRQPERTLAAGLGAALGIGLNFALIPRFAHDGAAVAAVAGDVAILVLSWVYLRRTGYRLAVARLSLRPTIAAAITAVSLWFARGASLALTIPLGTAIFAAAAYGLGAVRRSDLEWLRQAFAPAAAENERR